MYDREIKTYSTSMSWWYMSDIDRSELSFHRYFIDSPYECFAREEFCQNELPNLSFFFPSSICIFRLKVAQ